MNFEQYDLVTSTSKGGNSVVTAGDMGTIAYATNSVVFIYWHNLKRITRQTSKSFSIKRAPLDALDAYQLVSREIVDNAYALFKSKSKVALSNRRKTARTSVQDKPQKTIVETPPLDTPLGAVSALLNGGEYTPIEQFMILDGVRDIISRFNAHSGMIGKLFVSGSAIDNASELTTELDDIQRKLALLGITPEQLSRRIGE